MKNIIDLTEKKILVTGASSGIGREICILLSQVGANVVLVGRNEKNLQNTVSLMKEGNHKYFVYDLMDLEGIRTLIKAAVEFDNLKLDGYVHSAGVMPVIPLKNLSYSVMDETMKINYYSFIEIVKNYSSKNNCNGGNIVAISSIASTNGGKCQTIYSASKAAIDASVRTLAQELVKKGIRINSVRPSLIKTDEINKMMQDSENIVNVSNLAKRQLLGFGEPIDVANLVAFLLSDASSFITGRSIEIDGGDFL